MENPLSQTEQGLLLLVCPGLPAAGTRAKYTFPGWETAWAPHPGLSSHFEAWARELRSADPAGFGLAPLAVAAGTVFRRPCVLVAYSAGYALVRAFLRGGERHHLDGVVLLDGLHAALQPGPGRRPRFLDLVPWEQLARRAVSGPPVFYVGHSDVPTAGYASTTETAQALAALVPPRGNFVVRAYDLHSDPRAEHGAALTVWGPGFVQEALDRIPCAQAPAPPRPLGLRALELSIQELRAGIREEPPGSNTAPRIREYFSGATRGDRPLRLRAGPWCAAAASWACYQALGPGEVPPHGWRVSGLELERDARRLLRWHPRHEAVGRLWLPRPGDLAIYHRGRVGGWQRHVVRVAGPPDSAGMFLAIGGNEHDAWAYSDRRCDDADLYGFIEYPR